MPNENNLDRCFYYVIITAALVLFGIVIAIIIKYDLNFFTFLLLAIAIIVIPLLVIFSRTAAKHHISIKFTFAHILPCRKGFIKTDDSGKREICHRCVPFHFSVWPVTSFIISMTASNGEALWQPVYAYLVGGLGDIGYFIMAGIFLCAIPLEAVPTIIFSKESKNISRWITSILTTFGITLVLMYAIEYLSKLSN